MTDEDFILRLARTVDYDDLVRLIELSALALQKDDYTPKQIHGALGTVFGVDTQLISDATYYVIEVEGDIVACGGWSKRQTLFGSDANKIGPDPLLVPKQDAARIRAFFVHPEFARMGLGQRLIHQCEQDSRRQGFERMTLVATLSGERLYSKAGYKEVKHFEIELVNNQQMPVISMEKSLVT